MQPQTKHNKPVSGFQITERNLPHIQTPGSVYFVTFRTSSNLILEDFAKKIIYDNILYYSKLKYKLFAFTIMDDHVHIILQPNEISNGRFYNLSVIMQAIKGFAAKQIIKKVRETAQTGASVLPGKPAQTGASVLLIKHVFLAESFDRILRNRNELIEKMNYILNNSVRKGFSEDGFDYKWFYLYQA